MIIRGLSFQAKDHPGDLMHSRTPIHLLNVVQKALDYGFPISVAGVEHVQLDRIYRRALRRDGGHDVVVALPAEHLDLRSTLMDVAVGMDWEAWSLLAAQTAVINPRQVKSTLEMLHEARASHAKHAAAGVTIDRYQDESGVEFQLQSPITVRLTGKPTVTSQELSRGGLRIQSIDTHWPVEGVHVALPKGAWIYGTSHYATGAPMPAEVIVLPGDSALEHLVDHSAVVWELSPAGRLDIASQMAELEEPLLSFDR